MGISMQDSKLAQLGELIEAWPGLVSQRAAALIQDSLVLVPHLGEARRLVDVGSGGGLPGLALKIARPELEVTLVESDQAKAASSSRPRRALDWTSR
jgi:16S rRNA G527 N7-methylase RsmG